MHNHINIFSNYRNYSPFTLSSLFFFFVLGQIVSFYIFLCFSMKKNFRKSEVNLPHAHTYTCMLCSQIPFNIRQFCSCWMEHSLCEVGALIPAPPLTPKWKPKVTAVHYFRHRPTAWVEHVLTSKEAAQKTL